MRSAMSCNGAAGKGSIGWPRWPVAAFVVAAAACSDGGTSPRVDPGGDPPAGFEIEAPATVVQGQPFDVAITAMTGSGLPDEAWRGSVTLSSTGGTLSPSTVELINGRAAARVTLTGHVGAASMVARSGGVQSPAASLMVLSGQAPARIEIVPAAALLTAAGATQAFEARAFDAAGAPTVAQITWRTNDAATLAINADGLATAAAARGSAMITAEANGVASLPALVLVAQPAGTPVLLADSQIVSAPVAVDADAVYEPGWQYRIRVQGISPQVGEIVIGTGERPLAGRVVATTDPGGDTELTVELVALNELFPDLLIDETIPLIEMSGSTGTQSRPRGPADALPAGYGLAADTDFKIGKFECKASGEVPSLDLPNPSIEISHALGLELLYDGGIQRFIVTGQIGAEFGYKPMLKVKYEGKLGCEQTAHTVTIPATGILSWFFGIQVPLGIGLELDAKLEIAEVGFDVQAEASVTASLGMVCAPGGGTCGGVADFDADRDGSFEFIAPDPTEQFRVELGAHGYLFAKPSIGASFSKKAQFELISATGGLKQSINLATAKAQAADSNYASGFDLAAQLKVGAGSGITDAISALGKLLGVELKLDMPEVDESKSLAASPRGTFTITPSSVQPGDSTALGDLAKFKVELDTINYLGSYAVDKVEFFWKEPDEEGDDFTLEPGRPTCTEVAGSSGKKTFECETDFLEEHAGAHDFYAFVHAKLFGVTLPLPLEVANDARAQVAVGAECPVPPDWAVPSIVDESEISDGAGTVTIDGPNLSYTSVSGGARTESSGGWSPVPYIDGEVVDYVRIMPLEDADELGMLWAMVQVAGKAEAEIVGGACCNAYADGTAEIELWSDWIRGDDPQTGNSYESVEASAGASWSGDLPRKDTREVSDVRRIQLGWASYEDWMEMGTEIYGNARHRGGGNAALISASLDITVLDIVDDAGVSVPALICSAAGINYGTPLNEPAAAGERVAGSRPTHQMSAAPAPRR